MIEHILKILQQVMQSFWSVSGKFFDIMHQIVKPPYGKLACKS